MSWMSNLVVKQSLRLFKHEVRQGELTIMFLAIVLAVATVFSLSGFSNQIKSALVEQSSHFIAADRVLRSSRPISQAVLTKSQQLNLHYVKQVDMSSMVFSTDSNMLLASLTATSDLYPLKGELLVSRSKKAMLAGEFQSVHAPKSGSVWVDAPLLAKLKVNVNDQIEIGNSLFTIAGVIKQRPDASFSLFSLGPEVIFNIRDIDKTELIQAGSRVGYKYLFSGNKQNIEKFSAWLTPQLNDTQRWYSIKSQQNALAKTLNKAEKYLSLASLLGIILAAVAISVAARRYSQRHQSAVAVFKAMGASKRYITQLYLIHWSLLCVVSIVVGLCCGYLLQYLGLAAMANYLPIESSLDWSYPLFTAIITGLICAIAFALVPLRELIETSPLQVIRDPILKANKFFSWRYLPAALALFVLVWLFSRDWLLTFVLLIGGAIIIAILLMLALFLVRFSRTIGSGAGQAWQLALANLKRRATENSIQLVSFTLAINLLLLLVVVRSDLLADWKKQLPDNSANKFLINITQPQLAKVQQFVDENNLTASALFPVVPGRLTAINNERVVSKETQKEQIASKGSNKGTDKIAENKNSKQRIGIGRELNLTWLDALPNNNKILSGKWWSANDDYAQVSVEKSIAKRLSIVLGDELTFTLGSDVFTVKVTSIRDVHWQSMQPNFYMIFNNKVLDNYPATYIASLYIPPSDESIFTQFLAQYPTITVLDVDAMIKQLNNVIKQVSLAIAFILVIVVLAGCLVLVAQVQATMGERQRDLAILRTLGAKGRLLRNSVWYEFVALGVIAGTLASFIMEIMVYFIQTRLFNMTASFHFNFWLIAIVAGGLFVGLIGILSCWRLLTKTALHRYAV